MQYYIDADRVIMAIHDDGVTVPTDAYPAWKKEQTVEVYNLGEVLPEIPVTPADYDRAMEEHITAARVARGYTTREPTEYLGSSVPRWAQDATDYIAFRDACMLYGLQVQNDYAAGKEVPTLEEFKENLPDVIWTYTEEQTEGE